MSCELQAAGARLSVWGTLSVSDFAKFYSAHYH